MGNQKRDFVRRAKQDQQREVEPPPRMGPLSRYPKWVHPNSMAARKWGYQRWK
jgi:hypothetical protein